MRGDLDAITLKALEKDRSRRYATPSELAADIGRDLRNEPVLARPASATYRARKYVRRHRLGVSVAAIAVALLVSVAVAQAFELRRIKRERDRADRVTEFMTGMFQVSDPSEARGNDIRTREILDKAAKDIDAGLAKDPELQAQMMHVMGKVYLGLGLYSKAESLLRRAVEIRRSALGPGDAATLQSQYDLAGALNSESRYVEAEKLSRETMDARHREFGPENRDTLGSTQQLAMVLGNEGRYSEAEKLDREVLEATKRKFGPEDKLTATAFHNLGWDLYYQEKQTDAETAFRAALEIDKRAYGPDHPEVFVVGTGLANSLSAQKRYAEAENLYSELI